MLQPVASPSVAPSPLDFSLETVKLFPVSDSPSESESEPKPIEADTLSENNVSALGLSSDLHAVSVDPEVKKICDQTDHSSLYLATALPLMKDKPSVDSVLEVPVQAGSQYAKEALAEAMMLVSKQGTPDDLWSTIKDCKDGYDTAIENFQKSLDAFAVHDVGTMRSMLSAIITYVGDCEDEFREIQVDSHLKFMPRS